MANRTDRRGKYGSRLNERVRDALTAYLDNPRHLMSDYAIAKALGDQYGADAPSEDTVTRVRKEREERKAADDAGEWAVGEAEVPIAVLPGVLDVLAALALEMPAGRTSLTRGEVRTLVDILPVAQGLDPVRLWYVARSLIEARKSEDAQVLAAIGYVLAFKPWTETGLARYERAFADGHLPRDLWRWDVHVEPAPATAAAVAHNATVVVTNGREGKS